MKNLLVCLVCLMFLSVSLFAKTDSSSKTETKKADSSKVATKTKGGDKAAENQTVKRSNNWGGGAKEGSWSSNFSKKVHSVMSGYYFGIGLGPLVDNVNSNKDLNINEQTGNGFLDNTSGTYFFFGHDINSWFAMELSLASGFQHSDRRSIPYSKMNSYSFTTEDEHNFKNFYINTVFKYAFTEKNEALVKLGLGYNIFSNERSQNIKHIDDTFTITETNLPDNDVVFKAFGAHLALGYRYNFSKRKALGFTYNFYTTFDKSLSYKQNFLPATPSRQETIRVYYSSVMLEYTYHF